MIARIFLKPGMMKNYHQLLISALAAALAGSFKELVNLKEQGYKLSAKELDALKDADPKIYIAAQNIFNIKLDDPTPSLQFSESKNKNEVKQLSLNF